MIASSLIMKLHMRQIRTIHQIIDYLVFILMDEQVQVEQFIKGEEFDVIKVGTCIFL